MSAPEIEKANREARAKFGAMVKEARVELGVTVRGLNEILCETRGAKRSATYIQAIEIRGLTPRSELFFPLCELLGIDPMECGFVGELGDDVKYYSSMK